MHHDEASSRSRHPSAQHTLAQLTDPELDMNMHYIEAEHLAHQTTATHMRTTTEGAGITHTTRDRMWGPIRDTALALEHWGPNYRDTEDILRRHLEAAIDEINTTLT